MTKVLVSVGRHNEVPRLAGWNNTHYFLTFLEAGKSKIQVRRASVLGEGSLSLACSQPAQVSLCAQGVERAKASSLGLLLQGH